MHNFVHIFWSTQQVEGMNLEDWYVVVNFCAMLLRNTFGNPNNVAALLLLQLQVRVEYAKMELLNKRENV